MPFGYDGQRTLPAGYILEVAQTRAEGTVELVDWDGETYSWGVSHLPRYERVSRSPIFGLWRDLAFILFYTGFLLVAAYFARDEILTTRDWIMRAIIFLPFATLVHLLSRSIKRNDPPRQAQ